MLEAAYLLGSIPTPTPAAAEARHKLGFPRRYCLLAKRAAVSVVGAGNDAFATFRPRFRFFFFSAASSTGPVRRRLLLPTLTPGEAPRFRERSTAERRPWMRRRLE